VFSGKIAEPIRILSGRLFYGHPFYGCLDWLVTFNGSSTLPATSRFVFLR
jgi:hypothetical protein